MKTKAIPTLSARLAAAAAFGRRGKRFADIGTDHAYLPVFLYNSGAAPCGVASDINRGPVERAQKNISDYGAESAISVVLTDGLSGIESYAPEDIFILGMGGELITKIIDGAPWVRERGCRLILQPMTHPEAARRYLLEHGFCIVDELLVRDDKLYQIICAEPADGCEPAYSECELLFGRINIERGGCLLSELLLRMKNVFLERMRGKSCVGADVEFEKFMIQEIEKIEQEEAKK